MVGLSWQRAGTWRTKSGHGADTRSQKADKVGTATADTWRTQGGHIADIWRTRFGGRHKAHIRQARAKADSRTTRGGHKADTWRTKCGDAAKADRRRTRGGHMADTRRTSSGNAARACGGQFFLRENPTVNCLGKEETRRSSNKDSNNNNNNNKPHGTSPKANSIFQCVG